MYGRDHGNLPAERQEQEYDFLVFLFLAKSWVRVWITDLPNTLLFLREMGAQPISLERDLVEVIDQAWSKRLYDEDVQHLILTMKGVLNKLGIWQGFLPRTAILARKVE